MEHHVAFSNPAASPTTAQCDEANLLALAQLDYDTKIVATPLCKGFLWFIRFHFPFLAYIHLTQDLRARPVSEHCERAWEAIGDNYMTRRIYQDPEVGFLPHPVWHDTSSLGRARIFVAAGRHPVPTPPRIVLHLRQSMTAPGQHEATEQQNPNSGGAIPLETPTPASPGTIITGDSGVLDGMGLQGGMSGMASLGNPGFVGQVTMPADALPLGWPTMPWAHPGFAWAFRPFNGDPMGSASVNVPPGPLAGPAPWP